MTVGHVDSGKSTILGHFMKQCGGIDERQMATLEKDAAGLGKSSFKYAFLLDTTKLERERGVTCNLNRIQCVGSKYLYNIIDTPGHVDFIKNALNGFSQADAAIVVVSASLGEYEVSHGGKDWPLRDRIFALFGLGVRRFLCVINKMDCKTVKYSKQRYDEIKENMSMHFKKAKVKAENVLFIPVSGFVGENLTTHSANMPWYKGDTLMDALQDFYPRKRLIRMPLRLVVHMVFKADGGWSRRDGRTQRG